MAPVLPNFLVIGAARAGSTALHEYLLPHPDVFLPQRKELHYFDRNFDRGIDWYQAHFEGASGERAVGEATPAYMYGATTVARMASVVPGAKLVAILRHPVERAYSHYWMNRRQGREHLSFVDALAAEEQRTRGDDVATRRFGYVRGGRYLAQLQELCRHYPRRQLLVLLFDDLRAEPSATYRSLCQFLGVDPEFRPSRLGRPVNLATAYRSVRAWRLLRRLPPSLGPLCRALQHLNARQSAYPPLDPATRARLLGVFEGENDALGTWMGRDLAMWNV